MSDVQGPVTQSFLGWLAAYPYPVVFVGTLIDASGIPFPGRLLLIAAGAFAGSQGGSLAVIIALGAVAAMTMDHAWYFAGSWGSRYVLALYGRFSGWSGVDARDARRYFARYGAATIVVGRFFTSVRAVAWPVAATHGVGYAKFLVLDLVAATAWAAIWVLLGWIVGHRWASAADTAGLWLTVGGAVVLAAAATPVAMHFWRRHRRRQRA
jgi:membrane protein DedA with SNARE-associated domain